MKQSEINAALSMPEASRNVKDLHAINNEFSRVKYLLKSISSRKLTDEDAEVTDVINSVLTECKKIKLGGIVKKCVRMQRVGVDKFGREWGRVDSWIFNIVSSAERLVGDMLKAITCILSSRASNAKRLEALEDVTRSLSGVRDLSDYLALEARLTKAMGILIEEEAKLATENAEITPTEATEGTETAEVINNITEAKERGTEAQNNTQKQKNAAQTDTTGSTCYVDSEYKEAV